MEEKIGLDDISKVIESLKETSLRSKDYIKFIIGLSTGTLILSATLAKDFFKTPQYNFILIIGWTLLFVSIVVGVWILPVWDNLQNWGESIKRKLANSQEHHVLFKRKSGGQTLMGWMKELTHPYIREQEEIQKIFKSWENYLSGKDPKRKDLKKLKNLAETLGPMGVKEETRQLVKDVVTEMFKLTPFSIPIRNRFIYPIFLKR